MRRSTVGWLLVAAQGVLLAALVLLPWDVHGAAAVALGGLLVGAGLALGLAASRTLGRALTPTPVPVDGAGLRTDGPYAWVRHPIYSALLLGVLGLLVAAGTPAGWPWLLVLAVFFLLKSRWEDRLLEQAYGEQWRAWSARTGALLPRLGRR